MSENALAHTDKKRQQVLKAMPPELQEIARDFQSKLAKGAAGLICIQYDIGARVAQVHDNADNKYGDSPVEKLATYLGIPGGATSLYSFKQFAVTFDRDMVKENSARTLANGQCMTISHWLALTRLDEKKDQLKYLEDTIKRSLSANDLLQEIQAIGKNRNVRQGGRKPKTPSSPLAGLQKVFEMAQRLNNFEETAEQAVFDPIDELAPDKVNGQLLAKLEETAKKVDESAETMGAMKGRLNTNIERVKKILKDKPKDEPPAAAAEKPGRKKAGGKKKAKRRAAAATA